MPLRLPCLPHITSHGDILPKVPEIYVHTYLTEHRIFAGISQDDETRTGRSWYPGYYCYYYLIKFNVCIEPLVPQTPSPGWGTTGQSSDPSRLSKVQLVPQAEAESEIARTATEPLPIHLHTEKHIWIMLGYLEWLEVQVVAMLGNRDDDD